MTTDSLLFWIQMSEHNSSLCGELHDNLFLILSQLSSTLHTILAIITVSMHQIGSLICNEHARQIDGQNDNSVFTVYIYI